MIMKFTNKLISILLVICLNISNTSGYAYAATNITPVNNVLDRCESVNPANLSTELSDVIQKSFDREIEIDIKKQVNNQWILLKLSDTIDSEIDKAVNIVSSNTSLGEKISSNFSGDKIRGLTNEVVKLAFESPSSPITRSINVLSGNVADELSKEIEKSAIISSSQAINCVQTFISKKYSPTMLNVFNKHLSSLSQKVDLSAGYNNRSPDLQEVNGGRAFTASVAIAIIGRKLIKEQIEKVIVNRLSADIGKRIFGRLAFLEIPFFGEVVAAVLTLWDVAQGFNGALPIIQTKLKEPELKDDIQQKIIAEFESGLRNESSQIAGVIANELYSEWLGFKDELRQVLDIVEISPKFRSIFDKTNEIDRQKLTSLVAILLNMTGRTQVLEYIENGTFERLFTLPESAYKILTNPNKVSGDRIVTLVQWADLAGNELERVISTELYKHLSPKDLDRQLLTNILAIQDSNTINKLSLLDITYIRKLLVVSKQDLIALTNRLSPNSLELIANYFDGLEQIEINRIVKFLLDEQMPDSKVLSHIVKSNNINTAIQFWKQPSLPKGIFSMMTGNIHWELFTDKYGGLIVLPIALFVLPILLLLFTIFRYLKPKKIQDSQETVES
jgi:hypothetical protein